MRKLFNIINLVLCFELIIGPHYPGLSIFSINAAKAETCPSGLVFDSTLNRCITSDQQASIINATSSCNGDKECYKRIAEEELKKAEEEDKVAKAVANKSGLINTAGKVAAIAGPLTVVLGTLKNKKCMNASGIAMIAGGVAFTAGDFMANRKHKSCLKKIRSDWEKKKAETTETTSSGVTKVSMSQDQSEAFEMLAKSEECMQSSAKMKAGFYAASTLAFAASAVMATLEIIKGPAAGSCTASTWPLSNKKTNEAFANNIQSSKDLSSLLANIQSSKNMDKASCTSIDDYEQYKKAFDSTGIEENTTLLRSFKTALKGLKSEFNIIPSAHATPAAPGPLTGILKTMNSPAGRAAISGVLTGLSAMMWMHANKQAKVSKNRAAFLRNLKEEFNDATGAISCTAEERSVSANANCYCYTEDGKRNSARGNSSVCQQLWSGNSLAQAGNYSSNDFSSQRVCVAASGAADESCACAATKSCLSSIPTTSGNLGLGNIQMATNGLQPLNDLTSGQVGAGQINGAAAMSAAARLLDQKKAIEKKAKINPASTAKATKNMERAIMAAGAGVSGGLGAGLDSSSSFPMNMSPGDAAKALENELGDGRKFEGINGSPALAQPGSDKIDDDGFSVVMPDSTTNSNANQMAEMMAKDLDYNGSDITQSDSNLFQILTNRYQRSGMRRLFDDQGKTVPEAANKTDIQK